MNLPHFLQTLDDAERDVGKFLEGWGEGKGDLVDEDAERFAETVGCVRGRFGGPADLLLDGVEDEDLRFADLVGLDERFDAFAFCSCKGDAGTGEGGEALDGVFEGLAELLGVRGC